MDAIPCIVRDNGRKIIGLTCDIAMVNDVVS